MTPSVQPAPAGPAERLAAWELPVTAVRLVDTPRAEALAKLGVLRVGDLLRHYPHRYLDLSDVVPLGSLVAGAEATAIGTVHEVTVKKPRPRMSVTEVSIVDDSGVLIGVWFNQSYLAARFREGERVAFAGRVQMDYGLRQMRNPFVEKLGSSNASTWLGRILPVHGATEGLSTNWVRRLVHEALAQYGEVPDPLPAAIREARGLPPLAWALQAIHFPASARQRDAARRRLAYDELFAIQLGLLSRRAVADEAPGYAHTPGGAYDRFMGAVPFDLTGDQRYAISEIVADMSRPHAMNRMLVGDVGSGKTVVAGAALAVAHDSGTQAAMMAPTEVLANQYALRLGPLLDSAGIPWALLTGSTGARDRAATLAGLASGELSVLFGTHALLTSHVTFADLSLAIVDEQHRFGVGQRLGLRGKGKGVDLLVMTATPIPRSLALMLYGDLDTSWLRERPKGRGPDHITTTVLAHKERSAAYEGVREAVEEGHRAYVVCALVDESDASEARAAVREVDRLRSKVFPDLRVGLLTGQMRGAEKREAMESFRQGDTDVLVATTVVEVGVDVPDATVMVVEDADRFGLAQLHQLRGRVGRSDAPGHVYLIAEARTAQARSRLEAVAATSDGFELAERDLALRGEGEILGERQHGLPEVKLASVMGDSDLLDASRADASVIIAQDPHLRSALHAPLRTWVRSRFGPEWRWVSSG